MRRLAVVTLGVLAGHALQAQQRLTTQRIFGGTEFAVAARAEPRWMRDGRSVLEIRDDPQGGSALVRHDLVSGVNAVLADAATLTAAGGRRLHIENAVLSRDESKALLFHSSVRVWRSNTRGRYDVYDFTTGRLTPLVDSVAPPRRLPEEPARPSFLARPTADPSLVMFAKFSPAGTHVAYVQGNDLWAKDLTTGHVTRLTADGSDEVINGASDWVYEEELGLADAFRFSPDGTRIAFWRFDQSTVASFPLVNELAPSPLITELRYPRAGEPNSRVRVGVVDLAGGAPRWLETGADTGAYLPRMDWVDDDSLLVTRLTRRQDAVDLLMLSAASGQGRTMAIDRDSAYVGSGLTDAMRGGVIWLRGGQEFLRDSDRSGWRQVYLFRRDGTLIRQVTTDGADVLDVVAADEVRDMVYVTMAAPSATQRQVYRYSIHEGKKAQVGGVRLLGAAGAHRLSVGPTGQWALDRQSSIGQPEALSLYEFPVMRLSRVIDDNATLKKTLSSFGLRAPDFLRIPLPNGADLDAWRIAPPGFDPSRRYPVLMYAYGGPASPQVLDAWGGPRYLWFQFLAQQGYVVVAVDNRGAAWRGREFRKTTPGRLGIVESDDQISAARWLGAQSWVDPARIGIWGWSFGGYLTVMALARGGAVFKMGMAVAPVTDWRLYDTIYTERYLRTPAENPDGYQASSALQLIGGLTARLLLVHGTGDDNVHAQNTTQLVERLIEAGKRFDLMLYPNRTHAITGGNASVHLFDTLTEFVLRNL